MINIQSKDLCCGCSACVSICPKKCINLKEDAEGFKYPVADAGSCIDCGLCEKVCPVINKDEERLPSRIYAVKHTDETVRLGSSSGGVFTYLAERIIDEGGVVFGARFNGQWEVVHDYAETKEGLESFRGSKYVQSNLGNSYAQAEEFLKSGRPVMFTGTPCQIAGLKKYLCKEYDGLLAVDVVCHGVPSPLAWRKYLAEVKCNDGSAISGINFRDKSSGWKNYSLSIDFTGEQSRTIRSKFAENEYMGAFLSNLSLRPICYNCPAKAGRSGADITLGDFWGIENVRPEMDDDRGVSLAFVYGEDICMSSELIAEEIPYEDAVRCNKCMTHSVKEPVNRKYFFSILSRSRFGRAYRSTSSSRLWDRIKRAAYRKIR